MRLIQYEFANEQSVLTVAAEFISPRRSGRITADERSSEQTKRRRYERSRAPLAIIVSTLARSTQANASRCDDGRVDGVGFLQ